MATTVTFSQPQDSVVIYKWSALSGGENGDAVQAAGYDTKCLQAFGTFTSITAQGSNDGTNWNNLHKFEDGTLAQLTAAGFMRILENPLHFRVVSVGAGAGCTVILCATAEE